MDKMVEMNQLSDELRLKGRDLLVKMTKRMLLPNYIDTYRGFDIMLNDAKKGDMYEIATIPHRNFESTKEACDFIDEMQNSPMWKTLNE